MSKLNVVFMGTPEFAVPCLDILVKHHKVVAVVTQPDRPKGRGQKVAYSPVKEAALTYNLPVLQPLKVKTPEFQAQLEELKPDVIAVVAFGQLLPAALLTMPPLGCINVHASLLPYYRGAAPLHWSVINGETVSGVTTMHMDIGMDTGDMILKSEVAIGPEDTTGMLHDKLKAEGASLLHRTLELLAAHTAPRTPQPHELATYAPLLKRELESINWQQPAAAIHNLVRGLNPWPGACCLHQEKPLKIWQTRVLDTVSSGQPGRIRQITPQGFIVETGQGLLEVLQVQPASKRRMEARDFVRGYGISDQDILV